MRAFAEPAVSRHVLAARPGAALLFLAAVAVASCAPPPPLVPSPPEIPELRGRVDRSRADAESVIRLAAGLWSQRDTAGTLRLVSEAHEAHPEEPAYTAFLGALEEASGDYGAARAHYLEFLTASPSDLTSTVVSRLTAIRSRSAVPVVEALVEDDPSPPPTRDEVPNIVIVPVVVPDDEDLASLALAATEILQRNVRVSYALGTGLGGTPTPVLDWEVSRAARDAIGPGDSDIAAREIGDLLGARAVVTGRLDRPAPDSLRFTFRVQRRTEYNSWTQNLDAQTMTAVAYAARPSAVGRRVFEMLLGAQPGAISESLEDVLPPTSPAALLTLGDALDAIARGDEVTAAGLLAEVDEQTPNHPIVLARLDQLATLRALSALDVPLGGDVLALARGRYAVGTQLRDHRGGSLFGTAVRHGIGEAFGLDRLGTQLLADFTISHVGTSR